MALTDRAGALTPYLEQLLYDKDVQSSLRDATSATRGAWDRARGKSPREALEDKKLLRRLQDSLAALGELATSLDQAPAKQKSRRVPALLVGLLIGGAGVTLTLNSSARAKVMQLVGGGKSGDGHAQP